MFNKSKKLFLVLQTLTVLFVIQIIYLYTTKTTTKKNIQIKNNFVKLTSLPDLAVSSETPFIRHRSLATPYEIYRDDNGLLEYYPSTFIYKAHR